MDWLRDEDHPRPSWRRYGAAVMAVGVASLLSALFHSWLAPVPLALFFGAVSTVAWYAGAGPAVAAIVLSLPSISLVARAPFGVWSLSQDDRSVLLIFVLVSALLVLLSASRDRSERALRTSERRFRDVLETANEGVWLVDREGRTQYVNDRMATLLGTTPAQLAAGTVLDFVFPEDVPRTQERIGVNLAGGSEVFDFRFRRDNGEAVLVLAGTSPVLDGSGGVVGALGLFTDITARRRAEDALRATQERLQLAQEAGNVGVWDWDAVTNQTYWSESMWTLYGLEPGVGSPGNALWLPRLHPEDRRRVEAGIAQSLTSTATEYRDTFRINHPDGTERWIEVVARILYDVTGQPVRMSGVNLDVTERLRVEEALRESDDRLRQAAEAARIVVWEWDPAADRVVTTDNFAEIYGRPFIEVSAQGFALVHPDDRERHMGTVKGAVARGDDYHSEFRIVRPDTRAVTWIEERAYALPANGGGRARLLGVAIDVTEPKAAEEQLRQSEARARFLADASAVLATTLDYDEAVEQVVRLAVPVLADWCVVDLLGPDGALHRLAIVHGDPERAAVAEELRQRYPVLSPGAEHTVWKVLRSGEPWVDPEVAQTRFVAEARDETHRALLEQLGFNSELAVALRARDRTLGVLTLVQGDSGRRFRPVDVAFAEELARHCALAIDNARLYREARDAEATVRRLFDAGVMGLLVVDSERIMEANDAFLDLMGTTRADLAAGRLSWTEMTPPEYAERDARAIAEIAERGVCTPFEKEYVRADGTRVPVLLGAAAIQGKGPPWICAVVDLTAQKAAEQDRVAFIDAATHDLKNPLTSLKARVQLLVRRVQRAQALEPEPLVSGLAAIDADATRMVTLIDELMDTAHVRTGRALSLTPVPTDLVALAQDCGADVGRRTSHRVTVESTEAVLVGMWDRPRLERVVQNLLDNAVKYSPDESDIVLRVTCEHDLDGTAWAVLSVRDDGVGIPAADLPHIFEPFRRGGNVGATRGTGIGLAGARQIVAQHGGTITAESVEGHGSTITVRLPLGPQ